MLMRAVESNISGFRIIMLPFLLLLLLLPLLVVGSAGDAVVATDATLLHVHARGVGLGTYVTLGLILRISL